MALNGFFVVKSLAKRQKQELPSVTALLGIILQFEQTSLGLLMKENLRKKLPNSDNIISPKMP